LPIASAVFFDVDGTLVDTNYLHTWAWWRALAEAGIAEPMARVHRLIGKGGDDLLSELTGGPDEQISQAHGRYFAECRDFIRPLPGARGLLRHVHEAGSKVVLVTSAEEDELQLLLDPLDCSDVLDEVVHGESVEAAKPAPDLYKQALRRIGASPESVVALGDTGWDIEAARRSGIGCIAVETGGVAACELIAAGARATYGSCAELLENYEDSLLAAVG
jgi:HAD superfamily hydrolase (TIGR01509 family)